MPHSTSVRRPNEPAKDRQRSAIGNGKLLPGIDQRSSWVRRAKELVADYTSDLGGVQNVSTAELSLIRRIAVLSTELERLEQRFALAEQANPADLDLYQKLANTLRRLLTTIGLQRRAKTVSVPTLAEYLRGPHREAAE